MAGSRNSEREGNYYTNDANGNTLTGGGRTNVWDSQNRLYSTTSGGTATSFTYGSDGLRRSLTTGGTTTYYALDGQSVAREMQVINETLTPTVTYLNGLRGTECRADDSTGQVRWYLFDGLGSVLGEIADPDGNYNPVKCTRKMDVYGAERASSGTAQSNHKFVGSLGHSSDPSSGLIYMRARYMDPVTGRFVSEDPAYHGGNWYLYCSGNPVNRTDATGKIDDWEALGGAGMSAMIMGAMMAICAPGIWPVASIGISLFLTGIYCLAESIARGPVLSGVGVGLGAVWTYFSYALLHGIAAEIAATMESTGAAAKIIGGVAETMAVAVSTYTGFLYAEIISGNI